MGDFIHKINSNKAFKIIFCIVIAIPIWLLILFINSKSGNANVPAEIVISTEPTTVVSEIYENNVSSPDEIKEEKLNYTSTSDEEHLRVMTVGKVDFTEKYITENVREEMFAEILQNSHFKNVSRDQITNLKIEKYNGDKNAFIETGFIKDKQYVAAYILVDKNLVYAGTLYNSSDPQSVAIKNINLVIESVNIYIQQARASQ